jgi:hypothetical protein
MTESGYALYETRSTGIIHDIVFDLQIADRLRHFFISIHTGA